jgi:uncharacterized protein with HEPN domain
MRKDDIIRLQHMIDAAKEAFSFANNKTRQDLKTDRKLTLSLVKSIEIIGEAASRISKECQDSLPQIPWSDIITMRNRMIHAYFDINLDVVWNTVTQDIPPLVDELEKIISPERMD